MKIWRQETNQCSAVCVTFAVVFTQNRLLPSWAQMLSR